MYKCTVCGWIGKEEDLVELAGYLWDYTEHEACPECWKKDALDSLVIPEYNWEYWFKKE